MSSQRRRFLKQLAMGAPAAAAALLASSCGWDGGRVIAPRLAGFSRINDMLGELLLDDERRAPEYPPSARTADFPPYFISDEVPRLHPSLPWALSVGGLVRRPRAFTLAELMGLPSTTYTVKHFCVEGWTAIGTWTGVPLANIAAMVEPLPDARFVRFDSFDDGYMNGWDMKSALHPQTILAWAYADRPLTPEHGAPLRLYAPIKLGYKLTKYLTAVTFTSTRPGGYWEDQGYPWFAGV